MVGKYKAYPKYKDSGIEWLGGIPSDWTSKKIKYFTSCNDDVLSELTKKDSIIEYVDISSVSSTKGIEKTKYILFRDAPSRARRCVQDGDIIVSTVRTYLEAITQIKNPPNNLVVSTGFAVIRGKSKIDQTFLAYALKEKTFLNKVITLSVGISYPAINTSDLISIKVSFPNIDEQKQIANFLDHETVKIDTLIEKQQQLIKLLEEKRQAVISQAVTKGLNPNVSMKDSGVEWLGEIPEHWVIQKAKYLFILQRGYDLTSHQFIEGEYPVYGSNGIIGYHNKYTTSAPSLTVGRSGSVGEINFINVSFWAHNTSLYLKETNDADMRFIFYLLKAMDIKSLSAGSAVGSLDRNNIHACYIAKPPLEEQIKIAQHLDRELLKLSSIEQKAKFIIIKLKERRTALISAAVTGKIDVRDWQAPKATD